MEKISAVVITFNEEGNIERCLNSILPVVDELVVVDSFSTDRTQEICLAKGARFIQNRFVSHIEQKNFALSLATHECVLSLDADEYLSAELTESILRVKTDWKVEAYRMNRLSSYGGKWIRHGDWYPDRKIRLWKKSFGSWGGENPHDRVILTKNARVQQLKGNLMHRAYSDAYESIQKIQRYSDIFARENVGKKRSSVFKIYIHSTFAFFRSFVLKRGFQDGFAGLMVAKAVANHVFYKYSKLYELNRFSELGSCLFISRTDNLGDVVLTIPLAGYLKKKIPGLRIYLIGRSYTQPVIESSCFIDGFIDRAQFISNPMGFLTLKPTSIIHVFPDTEIARVAVKMGIKTRVGTAHRWYHWLTCNRLVFFSRIRSELHEAQLNFKLLQPFLLSNDLDKVEIQKLYGLRPKLGRAEFPIDPNRFNLIIHPKSKGHGREWPLACYLELVECLAPQRFQILITGLSSEGELIRKELPELFGQPHVVDMTGKTSLLEMMALISQSDALLAGSTGVLHVAAALGKPAIGLFVPLKPIHPGRWSPIGERAQYLVSKQSCSSCSGIDSCECIRQISTNQVRDVIDSVAQTHLSACKEGVA